MSTRFYHILHTWMPVINWNLNGSIRRGSGITRYEALNIVECIAPKIMYPPYYEHRLILNNNRLYEGRYWCDSERQKIGPFSLESAEEKYCSIGLHGGFYHIPTEDPRWEWTGEIWIDSSEEEGLF